MRFVLARRFKLTASPSRCSMGRSQDLPNSWVTPVFRLHMLKRLRRADMFQTVMPVGIVFGTAAWPLRRELQRRPHGNFRSSVTWLSDLLSTLRSDRYRPQCKTRFWPLVKRYQPGFTPDGSLPKVSDFNSHRYHPPSPSGLAQSLFSSPCIVSS